MTLLKSFKSNEDGNFAIMFAAIVAMLTFGMAAAIDISGMHKAKEELQSNLDNAALTAVIEIARNGLEDDDEDAYIAIIIKALMANGYDYDSITPNVTLNNGSLFVAATIDYDLQFGGILNKPSADIFAATKIALPGSGAPVEVALVLDNTNSMTQNGKLDALKVGATEFIDAIEDSNSGSKIAIVPFARYVNVGEDKRGEPWLEIPAEYDTPRTIQQGTTTGATCNLVTSTRDRDGFTEEYQTEQCTGGTTTYEEVSSVIESRWVGCVGIRSNDLHMQDGPYTSSATKIQGLLNKVPYEVSGLTWDVNTFCPADITPLTDDFNKLRNEISWLQGTDNTYIPAGLAWGRRVLSSEAPYTETDTADPKRKVMILMSDGRNTGLIDDGGTTPFHDAPPYIDAIHAPQPGDMVETNEDTAALCEAAIADGIEVYTIAFQVNDAVTRNLLKNCASSPSKHYNAASNQALVQAFRRISKNVGDGIRVMQ